GRRRATAASCEGGAVVIEAVVETKTDKAEVFRSLGVIAADGRVLASYTGPAGTEGGPRLLRLPLGRAGGRELRRSGGPADRRPTGSAHFSCSRSAPR